MGKLIERLSSWTRNVPLTSSRASGFFFRNESSSGREVGPTDALSLSAIFAGVRLLSEVIGMLPLNVFQVDSMGNKYPATNDPAYYLLKTSPNDWMTAKSFRGVMEFHRRLWGNAYAEIEWTMGGRAKGLWPIEPWRVKPDIVDGELVYVIDGGRRTIAKDDMLHIPLVTYDGVCGHSFIEFAIETLGLSLSAQDFAAEFFANGGNVGGILTHKDSPKAELRKEVREGWEARHVGKGKGHRTGVLWGGWSYESDKGVVDPEKSQSLESRRFSVEEAARLLGMPPHLLRDLSRATFSNIEEQGIDAVIYTWQPMCTDYEQEYDRKLLDSPRTFSKHNLNGLMRGNSVARATFYKELFQVGGITVNELLDREDENGIGPLGDLRFVPLNMQTLQEAKRKSEAPQPPEPTPMPPPVDDTEPTVEDDPPEPDDSTEDPQPNLTAKLWMQDTLDRLMRKEINQLSRAAAQPKTFHGWLDSFYEGHKTTLATAIEPVVSGTKWPASADQLATQWVERSRQELLGVYDTVTPAKFLPTIEQLASDWKAKRTQETLALMESDLCRN